MALFDIAFYYMLGNEDYPPTDHRFGRVTIDNNGALVRLGINAKYHEDLLITTYYTTMTNEDAVKVAQNLYNNFEWATIHGEAITSQRVASKILDMAVNMGSTEAAKLVQRAVAVNVDGAIGPITVGAINAMVELDVLTGLVTWWNWFIGKEIENNPEDSDDEEVWRARANKLPLVTGA